MRPRPDLGEVLTEALAAHSHEPELEQGRGGNLELVILHAGEIAAVIVLWVAGLTGILLTTAPEETRTLWRWSTRPRPQPRPPRSFADLVRDVPGADGDVVDSRQIRATPAPDRSRAPLVQLRRAVGMESERPGESAGVGLSTRFRSGASMMAVTNTPQPAIDPLAQQAATLLAKAMVTSHDRELLWQRFHELVVATAAELEEAPVREAIDEIERRGLSLDVVARVVQQRLGE